MLTAKRGLKWRIVKVKVTTEAKHVSVQEILAEMHKLSPDERQLLLKAPAP